MDKDNNRMSYKIAKTIIYNKVIRTMSLFAISILLLSEIYSIQHNPTDWISTCRSVVLIIMFCVVAYQKDKRLYKVFDCKPVFYHGSYNKYCNK